jgi:hypothetical protein
MRKFCSYPASFSSANEINALPFSCTAKTSHISALIANPKPGPLGTLSSRAWFRLMADDPSFFGL